MVDIRSIPPEIPVRIIIGAGNQRWPGWLPTQRDELNLLNLEDGESSFRSRRADAFLCEHIWEHLTEAAGRVAAKNCFQWLKPGGYLRCAVPDGNFPDQDYQRLVQVGGPGPKDHPAASHKIVYDHILFADIFTQAGFNVDLLEFCDQQGRFHYNQWSTEDGPIYRSLRSDHRNQGTNIKSVSLIIDAKKPG